MASPDEIIPSLRDASRRLVREWGFMGTNMAGSALPAPATHCLLEIGDRGVRTFAALRDVLLVSEAELAQTLATLLASGDISAEPGSAAPAPAGPDARYAITPAGTVTLAAVNAFAQDQAAKALGTTSPAVRAKILDAFHLYAAALRQVRLDAALTPDETPLSSPRPRSPTSAASVVPAAATPTPLPATRNVKIVTGYRPGILGHTIQLHMDYYSRSDGWGAEFEAEFSAAMSGLMPRLARPMNEAWSAVETTAEGQEVTVGTIFVDGECRGVEGVASLRAFVVAEAAQGLGLGRGLFDAAMEFVRHSGFRECHLNTMRSLTVARRMYEAVGFREVREYVHEKYGKPTMAMEYSWKRSVEDESSSA